MIIPVLLSSLTTGIGPVFSNFSFLLNKASILDSFLGFVSSFISLEEKTCVLSKLISCFSIKLLFLL